MFRDSPPNEEFAEAVEHIIRLEMSAYPNGQTFSGELVQHDEDADRPAVVSPGGHDVVRPYVVPVQRPEPNTRSIVEPQPAPLGLP